METKYLYRFDLKKPQTEEIAVELLKFEVLKETEKGYRINVPTAKRDTKWISKGVKQRYAFETKDLALTSALARTRRCCNLMEKQLYIRRSFLQQLEKLK